MATAGAERATDTDRARRGLAARRGAEREAAVSERRFRAMFERSVAGAFRTTTDGEILDCNRSLARMLGYESPEELIGTAAAARIGGDEFAVVLNTIDDEEGAMEAAVRLQAALAEPFFAGGHSIYVEPSVGVALYPDHGGRAPSSPWPSTAA